MKRRALIVVAISMLLSATAWAQNNSPLGLWKNIDDHTGKPKALIRITESHGEYRGRIEKLFRAPTEDQTPKCIKCEGELKNQPIIGMTILSGMKQDGDDYEGGRILDPGNGKTYKSRMELTDNGQRLKVRGYIGIPILGRTQTWVREE